MSTRTLSLFVLIPTLLALTACGIERRQDRREDRRDDRNDLVSTPSQSSGAVPTAGALYTRDPRVLPIG